MNPVDIRLDGIGTISAPLQIVLLLTLLSFLPAILVIDDRPSRESSSSSIS